MPTDREIAGIRCMQVLEYLSDYLDGNLNADTVERIENHLRGCNWCEQFGREFASTVKDLCTQLQQADDLRPGVASRLMQALEAKI